MLVVNPAKLENLREIVDEAVAERSISNGVSRTAAYLALAQELGYSVWVHAGKDGWACVISLEEYADFEATHLVHQARTQEEVDPLYKQADAAIATTWSILGKMDITLKSTGNFSESDSLMLLAEARETLANSKFLLAEAETRRKQIDRDISQKIGEDLAKAIVVFAASAEAAVLASILRMLDSECDAFFSLRELPQIYTRGYLRRRASCVNHLVVCADPVDYVPFFDDLKSDSRKMLARGVAAHITNSLSQLDN